MQAPLPPPSQTHRYTQTRTHTHAQTPTHAHTDTHPSTASGSCPPMATRILLMVTHCWRVTGAGEAELVLQQHLCAARQACSRVIGLVNSMPFVMVGYICGGGADVSVGDVCVCDPSVCVRLCVCARARVPTPLDPSSLEMTVSRKVILTHTVISRQLSPRMTARTPARVRRGFWCI